MPFFLACLKSSARLPARKRSSSAHWLGTKMNPASHAHSLSSHQSLESWSLPALWQSSYASRDAINHDLPATSGNNHGTAWHHAGAQFPDRNSTLMDTP
eukprot:3787319-Amphidinium_carterae.1